MSDRGDNFAPSLVFLVPAKDKLGDPRYQNLSRATIPVVELPDGAGTVRVVAGTVGFGGDGPMAENGLAVMSQQGAGFAVEAREDCRLLVLSGARIDEPINGHGPFVMNTYEEILQAYEDFKAGKLTG